jgi:hypothetical protein
MKINRKINKKINEKVNEANLSIGRDKDEGFLFKEDEKYYFN